MTISRRVLALGVVGLGLWAAIGEASAQEQLKLRFVIPTGPAPYSLPYFMAQDLGWYKKAGLEVEEKVVSGDPNSLRSLLAGEADVTTIGPNVVMEGIVQGAPIRAIASFQPITDYHIITRADVGKSLKELTDKSWAAFSAGGMSLEIPKMLLRKHGLDANKPNFMALGGMSARMQAVVAKKVDVTMVDTFFTAIGKQQGLVQVASIAKEFPGLGYLYAATTTKNLEDPKLRKALTLWVKGGVEGARAIHKNPDQAADVMKKRTPDVDINLIKDVVKDLNSQGVWGTNGGIDQQVTEFSAKTYHELGAITKAPTYKDIVDPSIVDAVIKEIGKM